MGIGLWGSLNKDGFKVRFTCVHRFDHSDDCCTYLVTKTAKANLAIQVKYHASLKVAIEPRSVLILFR